MRITFTCAQLLATLDEGSLADAFFAQQGSYMQATGLTKPPRNPEFVRAYAKQCLRLLRKRMASCKTGADWSELLEAYNKRTRVTGCKPEFV